MKSTLFPFHSQLMPFFEGDGGSNAGGGNGGGNNANNGGQNSNQNGGNNSGNQAQTLPLAEAERIAAEREERARKSALKSFFEQQGYSQEDVERLLKEDKEKREAAKTELQREKEAREKAEKEALSAKETAEKEKKSALDAANLRVAKTEFKIAAQAAGVPADRLEAAVRLADLSGLTPDEATGEIPADKIKGAVDATITANPFLKASTQANVGGGGSNPGGGGNVTPTVEEIGKMSMEEFVKFRTGK